jgi:hypothetical protein
MRVADDLVGDVEVPAARVLDLLLLGAEYDPPEGESRPAPLLKMLSDLRRCAQSGCPRRRLVGPNGGGATRSLEASHPLGTGQVLADRPLKNGQVSAHCPHRRKASC